MLAGILLIATGAAQIVLLFGCLIAGFLLVVLGNRMNKPQAG